MAGDLLRRPPDARLRGQRRRPAGVNRARDGLDASCAPIAADVAEPPGDIFLVGYSKGIPDALTLLVKRPDLAPRVKALFGWGGAFGGSYLADDIYESIKDLEIPLGSVGDFLATVIKTVFPIVRLDGVSERLDEYDVKGAIRDLTTPVREQFLADHAEEIDALDVPIFNLTAATTRSRFPSSRSRATWRSRAATPTTTCR